VISFKELKMNALLHHVGLLIGLFSGYQRLSANEISNPDGTNSASLAANATDGMERWELQSCCKFDFSTFR
jgi:hypothetical protein